MPEKPSSKGRRLAALLAWALFVLVQPGGALPLAMTKEHVQKKAVIIRGDAKLFTEAEGPAGKRVDFMQIFFLLEGDAGSRVPVTTSPNKQDPDGWLERSGFVEWNTLQMIDFEPQSGRELVRIFPDAACAAMFGLNGQVSSCVWLGSEPRRLGPQKDNYALLVPVIKSDGDSYQGWFVRIAPDGPVVRPLTDLEMQSASKDPQIFERKGIDASEYEIPIIIANLLPDSASSGAPDLVQGWVPRRIKGKFAVGEYIFMDKLTLRLLTATLDSIAMAAQEGVLEGGDSFLSTLRVSLATMLNLRPDDLFRPEESLDSMMEKAQILPFKTTVLSFTAEEVNAWKPADFVRLNEILSEKATALREFAQGPGNTHFVGDKPYLYVPRELFP